MDESRVTVGETTAVTSAANTAGNVEEVINLIAREIQSKGSSFKKISGKYDIEDEVRKALCTLYALSSVNRYATTITVGGIVYPIDAYKLDHNFAQAFLPAKEVVMPGTSPFRKDVSVHPEVDAAYNPGEMIEFQVKFLNYFKAVPNFTSASELLRPRTIGEITDCGNGRKYHVEDLATVKSTPVELRNTSDLFEEAYFQYDRETVIQYVVINYLASIK